MCFRQKKAETADLSKNMYNVVLQPLKTLNIYFFVTYDQQS